MVKVIRFHVSTFSVSSLFVLCVSILSKSSMALHIETSQSTRRRNLSVRLDSSTATAAAYPTRPVPILSAIDVARNIWSTEGGLYETDVHGIVRCHCGEDGDGVERIPRYRLLYMPMRNRGEIIRLILEEARVPYEVEVVGWRNWIGTSASTARDHTDGNTATENRNGGVKATTPHGKCPVLLTDIHVTTASPKLSLGQEGAITRYLAQELDLAGRTPAERAQVDSLYCLWFATMRNHGVSHDGEHFSIAALRTLANAPHQHGLEALPRPSYEDVQRLQALNDYTRAERSLMVLDLFERHLEHNKTGWSLVGEGCTYVDLGLFYILFELAEDDNVPDFGERFGLPRLEEFVARMEGRMHIGEYVRSPSRMPRYSRAVDGTSLYRYVEGKGSPRIY